MNTHRLTPLQALTIADKGGQEHRDTDRGDTLAPVVRSCWLSLSRSIMMHHKANEHSQGHTNTDRLALPRSYPYRRIQTQENRTQENTALPLATTDTGDRLAPVARSCWLSLSRSMMMNTAKEMNAHRDTGTPTGLHPYRLLPLPTQEDRDTGGRQARSPSVLSLQENTDTGGQNTGEYRPTIGDH